jgi:predicted lipoprotein with Yx(FWY)xxD motif
VPTLHCCAPSPDVAGRRREKPRRSVVTLAAIVTFGLLLAACGSSPSTSTTTTTPAAASLGASLSSAAVPGLDSVVVDARHFTVYVLSSGATMNLPCTMSNGCAALWPPVTLSGGKSASAGEGIHAALLGSVVVGGVRYATYHGWRLYEFSGDTGPGQSGGQGITSFGGTWHALGVSGGPVTSATPPTTSSTAPPSYGGY